jgi:hypothetical protein
MRIGHYRGQAGVSVTQIPGILVGSDPTFSRGTSLTRSSQRLRNIIRQCAVWAQQNASRLPFPPLHRLKVDFKARLCVMHLVKSW